jgi:hypothetical protein
MLSRRPWLLIAAPTLILLLAACGQAGTSTSCPTCPPPAEPLTPQATEATQEAAGAPTGEAQPGEEVPSPEPTEGPPAPTEEPPPADQVNYYPITVGTTWQYRDALADGSGEVGITTVSVTGTGTGNNNVPVYLFEYSHASGGEQTLYMEVTSGGVWMHRSTRRDFGGFSDGDFVYLPAMQLYSFPLAVGGTWQSISNLRFANGLFGNLEIITDTHVVDAIEDVSVPAGTYQNCFSISDSIKAGTRDPIGSVTWLCPGVGAARYEQLDLRLNARIVGELISRTQ